MPSQKPPLYYNLGAITRETGLHPDTLRAWERRYDLPQPTRSEGGQRLYSQRDLEIVRWLVKQQETGLRISQAADLFRTQIEAGIDPIEEARKANLNSITPVVEGENVAAYRNAWVEASMNFDNMKADQVLTEAFSMFPPETVCFEIMFGGLSELGVKWYEGQATVQQEHYASALVSRRLNALIAGTPPPNRREKIVIAAPPDEDHMLASLLMTFLLRRRGYDVVYLGADVPLENFRLTIEELGPHLVILTAHLLVTAAGLLELANELEGLETRLAYGGPIFHRIPELRQNIPGAYLGDDLKKVVAAIEDILRSPAGAVQPVHPDLPPYLEQLRTQMPVIESRVNAAMENYPLILSAPNHYISRYIFSAIQLGDISYLMSDLEWAYGLLTNFKMPADMLVDFLHTYAQAIEDAVDSTAGPLVDWLHEGAREIAEFNGAGKRSS